MALFSNSIGKKTGLSEPTRASIWHPFNASVIAVAKLRPSPGFDLSVHAKVIYCLQQVDRTRREYEGRHEHLQAAVLDQARDEGVWGRARTVVLT